MKKTYRALLSWLLTLCLLITPFSGVFVFAVDNNQGAAPQIDINIDPRDYVLSDTEIAVTFSPNGDVTVVSCDTRLEGTSLGTDQNLSFTPAEQGLQNGRYTLVAEAVGSNGVTAYKVVPFIVSDKIDIDFHYDSDETIVPSVSEATASVYEVEPLAYTMNYGTTSDGNVALTDVLAYDEPIVHGLKYSNEAVSVRSSSGIPYQTFDIALNGKTSGNVIVRYTGSTYAAERIAVKVYNPSTSSWDVIGTITGSDSLSEAVNIATYADNDTIHVMAVLDYVTNGSNTMIWATDPQHYTKFEDLNAFYYEIYQYAAQEYLAGNVGYIMNTGDLVDDVPAASTSAAQWDIADNAMQIIEAVDMPNGLVAGNHDVNTVKNTDYSAGVGKVEYSKFAEHFGAERYNTATWYGGSLNNNTSHYDLITVGNTDFVVVYLGYGVEATYETIVWANEVFTTYSHRVGIVATHQYLESSTADHAVSSRADLIFNEIVDPNPNVKMVLCGHDDGSIVNEVTASDGRTVYEMLSDYQFVEAENAEFYEEYYKIVDPDGLYNGHLIGSVPSCCGDGYIRLMTVEGNTLSSVTYSPVTNRYNPFGDRENITIDLDIDAPDREITTAAFSAYILGEESTEAFPSVPTAIVITKSDNVTTYHHCSYVDYPAPPPSEFTQQPVDLKSLDALCDVAESIDTTLYTEQSIEELYNVLAEINTINRLNDTQVSTMHHRLSCVLGAMKKIEVAPIDSATLQSVHLYDLTAYKWNSNDTVKTQLEPTGFILSRNTTNGWGSVNVSDSYQIKANNGKIYLNLDVEADCSWSIHITAAQANRSGTIVVNHAIDKAFNSITADSFNGLYQGVYDITDAFTAIGIDPDATISITKTNLYLVPGENAPQYTNLENNPDTVTYRYVEIMTDVASDTAVDTSELQALLNETAQLDSTLYTVSTWNALQSVITQANATLDKNDNHQADINLTAIQVQEALKKLKLISEIVPEPIGSLLPADEGMWVPNKADVMNIYRNENNHTVLENTNNEWPNATYSFPNTLNYATADYQIAVDITVATQGRIDVRINNKWITINKYITTKLDGGSGDMLAGTYTANIPLSTLVPDAVNSAISGTLVYAIGSADSSAITIRQLQVIDYVAPPHVEEECLNLIPDAEEQFTIVSGDGSVTVENGVLTAVNNGTTDLRITLDKRDYFNLKVLNSLHMKFTTDVPFKMAVQVTSTVDGGGSQWLNTSNNYPSLFTIENDGAAAGSYDVNMEIRDLSNNINDKSSCYFQQFIILVKGQGTFTLNVAEMIEHDNFDWDEGMTTYGPAATPTTPYYAHAAKKAPNVAEKYDILKAINYPTHPTITAWTMVGNQATAPLGLEIDISKTPYLYYSFAMEEGANFTFSLYSNSNYAPWLSFLDSHIGEAVLNQTDANWSSYQNREQYATTSQTGCIDMRQYLKDPNVQKWIINQITFYNSTGKNVIFSYFFFGSEPIPEYELGNLTKDEQINIADAVMLFRAVNGRVILSESEKALADVTKDGTIDIADAVMLFRFINGRILSLE